MINPGKAVVMLLIAVFQCSMGIYAQQKKTFTVNPGEKVIDKIPLTEIYKYPEYQWATVQLREGSSATIKLNYNSVFGEMQFIDPGKGDTISLADEKNIRLIAVEKDSFYFDGGWLEQVSNNGTLKIARKKLFVISNKEKVGAMDVAGFGAIETYSKFTGSQHMRDLVAKEKLTFSEELSYYFSDRFNNFSPAGKKSLLNIYRPQKEKIEQWLGENKINFNNAEDLQRLSGFLNGL